MPVARFGSMALGVCSLPLHSYTFRLGVVLAVRFAGLLRLVCRHGCSVQRKKRVTQKKRKKSAKSFGTLQARQTALNTMEKHKPLTTAQAIRWAGNVRRLAEAVGVTPQAVRVWRAKKHPPVDQQARIRAIYEPKETQ